MGHAGLLSGGLACVDRSGKSLDWSADARYVRALCTRATYLLSTCILTLPHFSVMLYYILCYGTIEVPVHHPMILSLNLVKESSGKGLVNMSAI